MKNDEIEYSNDDDDDELMACRLQRCRSEGSVGVSIFRNVRRKTEKKVMDKRRGKWMVNSSILSPSRNSNHGHSLKIIEKNQKKKKPQRRKIMPYNIAHAMQS